MIALIGCGTLGSRLASLLLDQEIIFIDHDTVKAENIGVQLFDQQDIGKSKAQILAKRHNGIARNVFLDQLNTNLLEEVEVVCDCTDNMVSRFVLNQWCVQNGVPLIHAAGSPDKGVIATFTRNPCLACVYADKIPVDACRGRDIRPEVAQRIAQEQARHTFLALHEKFIEEMSIIREDACTLIALPKTQCEICTGSSTIHKSYYITYCTQMQCYSTKPIRKLSAKKEEFRFGNITAQLKENGEIFFLGSEDIDELKNIADNIYNQLL